jgi:hypothetical protein
MRTHSVARALGWFSIGLGAAELVAPGALGRFLGTERRGLLRGFGLREIAAGLGILVADRVAPFIWGRVAGDVLDLAALGLAIKRGRRRNALIATGAVAGVTALDILVGQRLSSGARQLM